jgi:hypothetical protein
MKLSNLRRLYIHNRTIFIKGYNEVGIFVGLWNTSMLLLLTLTNLFGRSIHMVWIVVITIPFIAIVLYIIGYILYKRHFFNEENEWLTSISPPYLNTIHLLNEINTKLDNLKKEMNK